MLAFRLISSVIGSQNLEALEKFDGLDLLAALRTTTLSSSLISNLLAT